MLRIAVFGTGGVGGFFGALLAKSGHEVHLIARGDHLTQIQKLGLKVRGPKTEFTQRIHATDQPEKIGAVDLVLVCVKTWQLEEARLKLKPLVGPHTLILPLENGVHASEFLAEVFPISQVLRGFCTFLSYIESPGVIRHLGVDTLIALGDYTNKPSDQVRRIYNELSVEGVLPDVSIQMPQDILVAQWQKFLYIASMGAVGSLVQLPGSEFRKQEGARRLLQGAMTEVFHVGRALGIRLPDDAVLRGLQLVDELPQGATTSMQKDFLAGRRTELDAFSGEIIRLAEQYQVSVPIHQFCYDLLLPRELKARS